MNNAEIRSNFLTPNSILLDLYLVRVLVIVAFCKRTIASYCEGIEVLLNVIAVTDSTTYRPCRRTSKGRSYTIDVYCG